MTSSPAELMRSNLLEVFYESDADRRAAVIATNYSEDVVWHEWRQHANRVGKHMQSAPGVTGPTDRRNADRRRRFVDRVDDHHPVEVCAFVVQAT